mmetsp:Transcript_1687/g.3478  ORF Transcript_1687/g.3478 Transcript_1687/m.3478 type:complete len:132 (-) Transcript_1687:253-648(-)
MGSLWSGVKLVTRHSFAVPRSLHTSAAALAKAKGKKGGADEGPVEVATGVCDLKQATGLNLLKTGTDPVLGPDEAYPDWLWTLTDPELSMMELQHMASADPQSLTPYEGTRLMKLLNRTQIKSQNNIKMKG